ncbi:hypothetical protein NQ318_012957 [Aromia moschata]|uniref:C-type lectin domain-containing protein n=1 Tax=Aromia moschata TaxID=1265417 RepID=A0AAV8XQ56_9CUCU|nr:hypothetical protein NQ318_012957 [Aromia moschata]
MRCVYLLCIFVFPSISASYIKGFAGITEEINGTIDVTPTLNLERIGNKYYYFGAVFKGNYFQAMQFCNLHHMSLVSIETKEESEFLLQRLKDVCKY